MEQKCMECKDFKGNGGNCLAEASDTAELMGCTEWAKYEPKTKKVDPPKEKEKAEPKEEEKPSPKKRGPKPGSTRKKAEPEVVTEAPKEELLTNENEELPFNFDKGQKTDLETMRILRSLNEQICKLIEAYDRVNQEISSLKTDLEVHDDAIAALYRGVKKDTPQSDYVEPEKKEAISNFDITSEHIIHAAMDKLQEACRILEVAHLFPINKEK